MHFYWWMNKKAFWASLKSMAVIRCYPMTLQINTVIDITVSILFDLSLVS
jgi:hypothetical protein